MRLLPSLAALILGVVLMILGFSAGQNQAASDAATWSVKSLVLIATGVLCLLYGGVATIFIRK